MPVANFASMTGTQRKLFWNEVDLIQMRHYLFFPEEQKKYISITESDDGAELIFQDGNNLPSVIIMEIQFAFKLISNRAAS